MKWKSAEGSDQTAPAKKKGPGCLGVIGIVVVVLVVVVVAAYAISTQQQAAKKANQTYTWPSSELAQLLPQPKSDKGEVIANSDTDLTVTVRSTEEADYSDYLQQVKGKGFTEEAKNDTNKYTAYDAEGNELELSFNATEKEMRIDLDAAEKMGELTWPTTGPATLVPAPTSTTGKVTTNSSDTFSAKVGGTPKDDFAAYAEQVFEAGFDVNYSRGDTSFTADNADGAHVSVSYAGANVMSVSVTTAKQGSATTESAADKPDVKADAKQAEEQVEASEKKAEEAKDSGKGTDTSKTKTDAGAALLGTVSNAVANVTGGAVDPDVKEMLDSYETFMNNWVDFAKKYEDEGEPADMLADYTDLLQQELDWVNKINALDTSEFSDADMAYYLAVTGRVTARLAELA